MNIRNWGLGDIMQLPDCCFGRRWVIGCGGKILIPGRFYDISEAALPDVCVIWELVVFGGKESTTSDEVEFRLGDQLPATLAAFQAMPLLFPELTNRDGIRGRADHSRYAGLSLTRLRFPVEAQGRRLVCMFHTTNALGGFGSVAIVVSSIPSEVPDWLISGNLRSP